MIPSRPGDRRSTPPIDQAHGLRRMFGGERLRFMVLVHNPLVPGAGAVLERLCSAAVELGQRVLVVDASPSASMAGELARVDLPSAVEPLTAQVSYLAARGLPATYLDNRATMSRFLDALRSAQPAADVVLLHAEAADLRRMFVGRAPRPILLAGARPDSLTGAYASMKLLGQRLGALTYDLLVAGDVPASRARRMAERLGECADHFLGSALRHCALLDPRAPARGVLPAALQRLVADQLDADDLLAGPPRALPPGGLVRPGTLGADGLPELPANTAGGPGARGISAWTAPRLTTTPGPRRAS